MQELNKYLLDIKKGVIIHQVNCQHVMGAGIALEIRKQYPQHYQDYMNSELKLGNLVTTNIAMGLGLSEYALKIDGAEICVIQTTKLSKNA